MSSLVNQFDVRSVLHGQVSLAAVTRFYVFYEVMGGCKTLKNHLRPVKVFLLTVPRRCFFCGSFLLVMLHVGMCCSL